MAKVQQKSEKISAFGGIFFVLDKFDSILSSVIDSHLGLRCTLIGYQYSEIIRAIFSVFCCGGDCMEDLNLVGHQGQACVFPPCRLCPRANPFILLNESISSLPVIRHDEFFINIFPVLPQIERDFLYLCSSKTRYIIHIENKGKKIV